MRIRACEKDDGKSSVSIRVDQQPPHERGDARVCRLREGNRFKNGTFGGVVR